MKKIIASTLLIPVGTVLVAMAIVMSPFIIAILIGDWALKQFNL